MSNKLILFKPGDFIIDKFKYTGNFWEEDKYNIKLVVRTGKNWMSFVDYDFNQSDRILSIYPTDYILYPELNDNKIKNPVPSKFCENCIMRKFKGGCQTCQEFYNISTTSKIILLGYEIIFNKEKFLVEETFINYNLDNSKSIFKIINKNIYIRMKDTKSNFSCVNSMKCKIYNKKGYYLYSTLIDNFCEECCIFNNSSLCIMCENNKKNKEGY